MLLWHCVTVGKWYSTKCRQGIGSVMPNICLQCIAKIIFSPGISSRRPLVRLSNYTVGTPLTYSSTKERKSRLAHLRNTGLPSACFGGKNTKYVNIKVVSSVNAVGVGEISPLVWYASIF
jgi:hypothetical protein